MSQSNHPGLPNLPDLPNLRPWTLWAKWSSSERGSWHPLLFHLIDVAMCAEAMWDEALSPATRQHLATGMGLSTDDARAWTVFLAGLHDIGKGCPGFQLQLGLSHIQNRLALAGLKVEPCAWVSHGTVSAHALRDALPGHFGIARPIASAIATTLGGHHGIFPTSADINGLASTSLGQRSWEAARLRYIEWFAELMQIKSHAAPTSFAHPTAVLLGGFISVVDWLGSDESIFTHGVSTPDGQPAGDLPGYLGISRGRARDALRQRGWMGWAPGAQRLTFDQLFPGKSPRPLQTAVEGLAARLTGPSLVIVEAPMGEGKTEAAMLLADTWTATSGQRGMYFALPTQATSNQMYNRTRDFLAQRYPHSVVNLQLLHGHAALSAIVRDMQAQKAAVAPDLAAIHDSDDHHPREGKVIAAEWFASGKRALLAPFGVGTVDQALLAALQVKHFFVRLYGLGSKTIIIDEVHAYDTYMSTLIARLLEWLAALGAPVILLSATLPASRRQALLDAYALGAGWEKKPKPEQPVNYPRVTWTSGGERGALSAPADPERASEVALHWLDLTAPRQPGDAFPLADILSGLLDGGGCCAVICNTVARAQAIYAALKSYFPAAASDGLPFVDLFHARFMLCDRTVREARALSRFGKDGPRPKAAILVATQVVEQSLDLDFDLLVTDLAPVDLVLQRAGRLHRHKRARPPKLAAPTLFMASPIAIRTDGVPVFDGGSRAIYAPHILLKSWLALRDRHILGLPEDISPFVQAVYDSEQQPENASTELLAFWATSLDAMRNDQESDASEAQNRYIKRPSASIDLSEISPRPREEDSPELHPKLQALTRLTELSAQVICLSDSTDAARIGPDGPIAPLKTTPSFRDTLALLDRSVQISNRFAVHALLELPVPQGWQESPMLRRARALFFDADGVAIVGKVRIRLDAELGLVIETPARQPHDVDTGQERS